MQTPTHTHTVIHSTAFKLEGHEADILNQTFINNSMDRQCARTKFRNNCHGIKLITDFIRIRLYDNF